MKHPLLAVTAAIAALLVGVGGLGGPWVTAGAGTVLVVALALGWPQLLGAPARASLTTVLVSAGLLAVWAVALWPPPDDEGTPAAFGESLVEPVAMCLALGTVAAFLVQLFRGSGRPHRLESTAGTITGVAVACAVAGWTVLARYEAGAIVVSAAASVLLAALAGLVPLPRPVGALLAVVLAGVVPFPLSAALPALPLPAAVVSGALSGLVVVLTGRTAPRRGSGRPVGHRASVALGVAPVAVAGMLTYFVFRIVPA